MRTVHALYIFQKHSNWARLANCLFLSSQIGSQLWELLSQASRECLLLPQALMTYPYKDSRVLLCLLLGRGCGSESGQQFETVLTYKLFCYCSFDKILELVICCLFPSNNFIKTCAPSGCKKHATEGTWNTSSIWIDNIHLLYMLDCQQICFTCIVFFLYMCRTFIPMTCENDHRIWRWPTTNTWLMQSYTQPFIQKLSSKFHSYIYYYTKKMIQQMELCIVLQSWIWYFWNFRNIYCSNGCVKTWPENKR